MSDASVRVICRFRPINDREKQEGERDDAPQLEFPDDQTVVVKVPKMPPQVFQFDRVFWNTQTKQRDIYDLSAKDTIEDVLEGYNGTIFAYGQTGAGKSFTMFGPGGGTDEELKGIIPRACGHIFDKIAQDESGTEYILKSSFLEIYKENIRDLLDTNRVNLKVRETPSRGVWVQDLSEHFVSCVEDIFYILELGEKSRSVSSTKMNSTSSRSHSLFILTLAQKNVDGSTKEGKLNLADLAGSEKVGKTGATGETLEEAKKINQSLSALGNCINALTKNKKGHIPYRDSKLTHILRESLGGNAKTTLIIACSPHSFNVDETISTLKFGQRAKSIKNKVKINQQRSVKELEAIIDNLTKEMAALRAYITALEETILSLDPTFDLNVLKKKAYTQSRSSDAEVSTPVKGDANVDPSTPMTPGIEFGLNYDPMAVAEMKFKLNEQREEYELKLQDLKDELESLQRGEGKGQNWEELSAEAERYKSEVEELKRALESEHKDKLLKSKLEYESKTKEVEDTQILIGNIKNELESKIAQLMEENLALMSQKDATIEQNENLTKELNTAQETADKLDHNIKDLQSKIDVMIKEKTQFESKKNDGDTKISELETEITSLKKKINQTTSKLKETEIAFETKVQECELVEQAYREALSQMDDSNTSTEVSTEFEKLKQELSEEKKKNIQLTSDAKRKEIDNIELSEQLENASRRFDQATDTIGNLQDAMDNIQLEVLEKEKRLEDQIYLLEQTLKKEKTLKENAENEVRRTSKRLLDREGKLKSSKELLEKIQRDSITANNVMTTQLNQANKRIQELENEVENLNEQVERMKVELDGAVEAYMLIQTQMANDSLHFDDYSSPRKVSSKGGNTLDRKIIVPVKGGIQKHTGSGREPPSHEKKSFMGIFSRTIYPTVDQLGLPSRVGVLWKQTGIFRTWTKKWFFLKGHYLYYFSSKESDRPDGFYDISSCTITTVNKFADHEDKFPFSVENPDKRVIFLCAESNEERISWCKVIDMLSSMSSTEATKYIQSDATKLVEKFEDDEKQTN